MSTSAVKSGEFGRFLLPLKYVFSEFFASAMLKNSVSECEERRQLCESRDFVINDPHNRNLHRSVHFHTCVVTPAYKPPIS